MLSNESPSVLFFINGLLEAKTLFPLICQFDKKIPVHVVVTGEKKGLSGDMLSTILTTSKCTSDTIIHDLDLYTVMNSLELSNHVSLTLEPIIQAIQPRLFFHLKDDVPLFNSLDTMAKIHHLTTIQLHSKDVQHALWITKLPIEALQYWNRVNINLIAITDRRPHSLSRLFNSLNHATYFDDKVDITIHMEQTADRVTKLFVNSFNWKYGLKSVRHRIRKGGLMPAIIESWYPSDNHSYGVLLEDDIEVSPLFYAWIKYNILHYRYSVKNVKGSQWIYGISLYSPRNLELLPDGRKEFDPNEVLLKSFPPRTPYASQVPCSWGAVYFPEHWREFHQYLTSRLLDLKSPSPRLKITVPKSRSSRWKKSWKKYFIEMVYLRAYVMIYPNFQDFESFSTNHLEFGTHIKHERAQMAINSFVVPLMQRDTIMDQLPHHQLPDFKELPFMDLWGNLKTHRELDQIGEEWHRHVSSCIRQPGKYNPQDLLCPLYRGNSTINNNSNQLKLKSPPPLNNQASMAGIAIKNDDDDYEKMKNDNINNRDNNNKNMLDTDGWEDMSISLDVAKMTTNAIDHDNEDDEMKDLEASWEVLTQLGKQLQSHF
ncbi:hypothetical protein BJ944DRAFT_155890 [Cunninghamella echinulata]|nr:hypothetical protein BJ944DRAFT_155890 [Cunninghamella echinulata]